MDTSFSTIFDTLMVKIMHQLQTGTKPWKAGWPVAPTSEVFEKIDRCEVFINQIPSRAVIIIQGDIAVYKRDTDTVMMPDPLVFVSNKAYYATTFHELSHSTSHESRLNRKPLPQAGDVTATREKAKEEIIAELSAACICVYTGIIEETFDNHVAFIKSWLQPLLSDMVLFQQLTEKAKSSAAYLLQISL